MSCRASRRLKSSVGRSSRRIALTAVRKPTNDSFKAVRETMLDIVTLSLDSDQTLLPRSAKALPALVAPSIESASRSPIGRRSESEITTPDANRQQISPQLPGSELLDLDLDLVSRSVGGVHTAAVYGSRHTTSRNAADGSDLDDLDETHDADQADYAVTADTDFSAGKPEEPNSADGLLDTYDAGNIDDGRDPDDFSIMDETQAKRIVVLCTMAFGVEISPDAVLADANVGLLARRVVGQRSLVSPAQGTYREGGRIR